MAKKKTKRVTVSPVRAQDKTTAQSEATVRFGPEHSTLKTLLGEAEKNYATDLTAADAAAKSAIHFAQKSAPRIQSIFDAARSQTQTAAQDVENAFGRVGAGADPFRAATSRELGLGAQRVAQAQAAAQKELSDRQLEAVGGRQYARQAATTKYRSDLSDLQSKLADLGDREGAYMVGRMGALQQSRAQRKATSRSARISARGAAARQTASQKFQQQQQQRSQSFQASQQAKRLAAQDGGGGGGGGRSSLGGNKPATRAEARGFQANFAKAKQYASAIKASKSAPDRHKAARALTMGQPAYKDPSGAHGAIPSVGDQLALSVALDMTYDGHVSRANAAKLKQAGLRVADVEGATSYTDWYKRSRRPDTAGNPNVSR